MDKDLAREVERLQAQVAALSAQVAPRAPSAADATPDAAADSPIAEALHKAGEALPEWKDIEKAVESLKGELEKHPMTGIAVAFALGLTIGQLLRR